MPEEKKSFVTMWRIILALIFAAGIYSTYLRFAVGWHAATNMSDAQPWGIWVGLATLCGVGLSAGGFATAAAVYLLGMERYRPICRTAIMIALLGYGSVCVGYAYELGLPGASGIRSFTGIATRFCSRCAGASSCTPRS